MDDAFTQELIDSCKALIRLYTAALTALATNKNKSYTLNTGQTVETVTIKDEKRLMETRTSLMNECVTLEARLNGGSVIVRPGW